MAPSVFDQRRTIEADDMNRLASGFGQADGAFLSKFNMRARIFSRARVEKERFLLGNVACMGTGAQGGIG